MKLKCYNCDSHHIQRITTSVVRIEKLVSIGGDLSMIVCERPTYTSGLTQKYTCCECGIVIAKSNKELLDYARFYNQFEEDA
jgi:hypothetical protein